MYSMFDAVYLANGALHCRGLDLIEVRQEIAYGLSEGAMSFGVAWLCVTAYRWGCGYSVYTNYPSQ